MVLDWDAPKLNGKPQRSRNPAMDRLDAEFARLKVTTEEEVVRGLKDQIKKLTETTKGKNRAIEKLETNVALRKEIVKREQGYEVKRLDILSKRLTVADEEHEKMRRHEEHVCDHTNCVTDDMDVDKANDNDHAEEVKQPEPMALDLTEQTTIDQMSLELERLRPLESEVLVLRDQGQRSNEQLQHLQTLLQQQAGEIAQLKRVASQATSSSLALDDLRKQREQAGLKDYQLATRESDLAKREQALKKAQDAAVGKEKTTTEPAPVVSTPITPPSTNHQQPNASELARELHFAKLSVKKLAKALRGNKDDYKKLDGQLYSRHPKETEEWRVIVAEVKELRATVVEKEDKVDGLEKELSTAEQELETNSPAQAQPSPASEEPAQQPTPPATPANVKHQRGDDEDDDGGEGNGNDEKEQPSDAETQPSTTQKRIKTDLTPSS